MRSFYHLFVWAFLAFVSCQGTGQDVATPSQSKDLNLNSFIRKHEKSKTQIPEYVTNVLSYVRKHGHAPSGYVGGRKFFNREKILPLKDHKHQTINYREWDVHPRIKGSNRGSERLITSKDLAFYTKDHYKSFQLIKE